MTDNMEQWWPLRFFQRIWLITNILLTPLKVLSMLAEIISASIVIGAFYIGWAIYTGRINEDTIAPYLATAATHVTSILHHQGIW